MLLSSLSRQDVPHGPHWCRAFLLLCTIFWNLLGISAFRPSSGLRIQKAEYLRPGPQRVAYSARAHARLGLLFAQPRPPQRPRPPRAAPAMAASADAPAGAEAGQRGRGLHSLLGPAAAQKFAFFGGKGGVGKTSASAAAAVRLADAGYATLVLSTDPAHSLGDALGQSLAGGRVERVAGAGEGGGGEGGLWALEVDAARAVAEFQEVVAGVDLVAAARSVGLPEDIIQQLGLKEMVGVLRNPPPGLDELVALAKVVRLARGEAGGAQDAAEAGALGGRRFDRIVIDTAPTGHTLRLLAFPDFLDGFLGKVIELRAKVDGALRALKGLGLFSDGGQGMVAKTEAALLALERYRAEMLALRELFRDPESTEFVVVTIPTQLAVAESVRLVGALVDEGIAVRTLVANRLVDPAAEDAYLARLAATQRQGVAQVEAWRDAQHPDLSITKVPYFDLEVVGPAALQFLGSQAYNHAPGGDWAELFQEREGKGEEGEGEARFVIFGGKGGVGKTSSSAALAASFAAEGLETVVVSTDPAHSLGDALQADLSSGELVPIEGVYGTGGGAPAGLWALEVDPAAALGEFKAAVGGWAQDDSALLRQFSSFADVLDTAPPGTDELVALAKVLDLVKGDGEGGGRPRFDRVVIDTAPTGHTLRLLAFPDFLGDFFERLIRIRDRLKKTSAVFNAVSSVMSNDAAFKKDAVANAKDRLRAFQFQMFELEELFRDEERAEFVVVTIPTALALAESQRLVAQLKEEDIAVRRLVLNQLLDGTGKEGGEGDEEAATERRRAYFRRLAQGQEVELKRLEGLQRAAAEAGGEGLALVRVPYFDAELTGVPGLRAMAQVLFAEGGSGGQ